MNEAKLVEEPQSEKKRDQKYFSKFKYRTKIISRKCPSGKMLGTPSFTDKKGQRPILKYFKKNVIEHKESRIPTIGTMLERVF